MCTNDFNVIENSLRTLGEYLKRIFKLRRLGAKLKVFNPESILFEILQ